MIQVPENLCNANYMPTAMKPCAPEPCDPAWNVGPWSPCSESCERGVQERQVRTSKIVLVSSLVTVPHLKNKLFQVYCAQIIANGLPSMAEESECEKTGEKPPSKQECNLNTKCPDWHTGPWKRVSNE